MTGYPESPANRGGMVAVLLLATHAGLLAWSAAVHSPTWNETGHLVAGLSHWELGRFGLYRVNPPLVRAVAVLPVLCAGVATDYAAYDEAPGARAQWDVERQFVRDHGRRVFRYVTWARWALIPLSLWGGVVCWRWAGELYGRQAGLAALTLWCFSPNILAHASLITPDLGAAAVGIAAGYSFWKWLNARTWSAAGWAGCCLGLAELTKSTWLVLLILWPLMWLCCRPGKGRIRVEGGQLLLMLTVALLVLNAAYLFEGTGRPLGSFDFVSRSLTGHSLAEADRLQVGNRFSGTLLGRIPLPLPSNYVQGIDLQRGDFQRGTWSYLAGQWRHDGWWYWYLAALAIKVPLGTLLLAVIYLGTVAAAGWSRLGPGELLLILPAVTVLAVVSSQTGMNQHFRYLLPAFPFAFILLSRVFSPACNPHARLRRAALVALGLTVASSLWVYPHSLAFFNLLAGGPGNGHAWLGAPRTDSTLDWGQDLLKLERWLKDHPEVQLDGLAFNGPIQLEHVGWHVGPLPASRPQQGWYAASISEILERESRYAYLRHEKPYAVIGYTIYVYAFR